MRRFIAGFAVAVIAVVGSGGAALADNTGEQPQGPPVLSGRPDGTTVCHLKALGGQGVVVINKNGVHFNGGADEQSFCGGDE